MTVTDKKFTSSGHKEEDSLRGKCVARCIDSQPNIKI